MQPALMSAFLQGLPEEKGGLRVYTKQKQKTKKQ